MKYIGGEYTIEPRGFDNYVYCNICRRRITVITQMDYREQDEQQIKYVISKHGCFWIKEPEEEVKLEDFDWS